MTLGRIPNIQGGIQPTIVDAKGDLVVGVSNDNPSRLAVGTSSSSSGSLPQVLVADSTQATGLKWSDETYILNVMQAI